MPRTEKSFRGRRLRGLYALVMTQADANLRSALAWIDSQHGAMADRVARWCRINSGTANQEGVEHVAAAVLPVLKALTDDVTRVPLPAYETVDDAGRLTQHPVAPAIVARKRPDAPVQALLVIHLDTVYGPEHPFQDVATSDDQQTMHGPGVADAKGGLAVMLTALECLERAEPQHRDRVGWTVLLNPDEEIGSPASMSLLHEEARKAHVGMVYEPALPNGDVIAARKGSGNYTVTLHGRSAHAGREFFKGRNAVTAAAELALQLAALTDETTGTTVNVAKIAGGGANNVVPDLAVLRCNARVADPAAREKLEAAIALAVGTLNAREGFAAELHGTFNNPPKPRTPGLNHLLDQLADAGHVAGVTFGTQDSGGVCDGNKLAATGLPTIDTLGPVGGHIHSPDETLNLDSLVPRAKLSAALLLGYANGRHEPPPRDS